MEFLFLALFGARKITSFPIKFIPKKKSPRIAGNRKAEWKIPYFCVYKAYNIISTWNDKNLSMCTENKKNNTLDKVALCTNPTLILSSLDLSNLYDTIKFFRVN